MNRHVTILILMLPAVSQVGCKDRSHENTTSSTPAIAPHSRPTIQVPPEYPILAEVLAIDMKSSPEEFQKKYSDAEVISEYQTCVMKLDGIISEDNNIVSLAKDGSEVGQDIVNWKIRYDSLPKPTGTGLAISFIQTLVTSTLGGAYGGVTGDLNQSVKIAASGGWWEETSKVDVLLEELEKIGGLTNRRDALQMMLPFIAQKYAASPTENSQIVVDIDESWGGYGAYHDWVKLYNSGHEPLENCTIQVQLAGSTGEVRKNVHFVRYWPAQTWMYARYQPGMKLPSGKFAEKTTVTEIQGAAISVWSPNFTTHFNYAYQGAEKDKDIAEYCSDLSFNGMYRPFQSGILWNVERGVEFTHSGGESIDDCHVEITFRKGWSSKKWSWDHDHWEKDEKKIFSTPKGKLTFEPSHVDLKLSFPGTDYQYKATLGIK